MSVTEQLLTVRNPAGHALHCVLSMPAGGDEPVRTACLLLSPGVKMRVAPHRLYRKLQAEFLERNMAVLRVDFHGLGDSEGELPETQLDQLYRQVQLGRHVDDVIAAMNGLVEKFGIRRFIVGGLCGGALTGLLAARRDDRIVGVYTVGLPVILDGTGAHVAAHMTRGQLTSLRGRYLENLTKPSSWLRFLSFKTDYRLLLASALAGWRKRRAGKAAAARHTEVTTPVGPVAENLNPLVPEAFFGVLAAGRPILLIFSGADRLQWEFEEKLAQPWARAFERYRSLLDVSVVPKANHVLGDPQWVDEARAITRGWLGARFGAEGESNARIG